MDTTSQEQGQSSLTDEMIGEAYFKSAIYNGARSVGFPPKWRSLTQAVKEGHIKRGKFFLQSLERLQQQAEEVKP